MNHCQQLESFESLPVVQIRNLHPTYPPIPQYGFSSKHRIPGREWAWLRFVGVFRVGIIIREWTDWYLVYSSLITSTLPTRYIPLKNSKPILHPISNILTFHPYHYNQHPHIPHIRLRPQDYLHNTSSNTLTSLTSDSAHKTTYTTLIAIPSHP